MTRSMDLDYVRLAPGFAREFLEIYENWEERDQVPVKVRELMMMVIEIEVNKLYDPRHLGPHGNNAQAPKTQRHKLV